VTLRVIDAIAPVCAPAQGIRFTPAMIDVTPG